jgi:hypothetical protein
MFQAHTAKMACSVKYEDGNIKKNRFFLSQFIITLEKRYFLQKRRVNMKITVFWGVAKRWLATNIRLFQLPHHLHLQGSFLRQIIFSNRALKPQFTQNINKCHLKVRCTYWCHIGFNPLGVHRNDLLTNAILSVTVKGIRWCSYLKIYNEV